MRTRLAVLGLLAVVACAEEPRPAPKLVSVTPSEAPAEAPMPLHIVGEGFAVAVQTDFENPEGNHIEDAFEAALIPADATLPTVALMDVRLQSATLVTALVPPGVAPGYYTVQVVDAAGERVQLETAYRVLSTRASVTTIVFDAIQDVRAGVPLSVGLTALDVRGNRVEGYDDPAIITDESGALAELEAKFSKGRAHVAVLFPACLESTRLIAKDDFAHTGRSEPFTVSAGFPVTLAFTTQPQRVAAGNCSAPAEIEARDVLGLAAALEAPVTVKLVAGPSPLAFFSDSECSVPASELVIEPALPRARFHYRGEWAGNYDIVASSDPLPSAIQPNEIAPAAPVAIAIRSPAQRLTVGECSAALEAVAEDRFGNAGPVGERWELEVTATPDGAAAFFADAACTVPMTSLTLAANDAAASFYLRAGRPGLLRVEVAPHPPLALASGVQVEEVVP